MPNTDLINRLKCRYPSGPIQANGEPEFGYRDLSGQMLVELPSPVMLEAAAALEAQDRKLSELEAAVERCLPLAQRALL
jgi:hypothetical protein